MYEVIYKSRYSSSILIFTRNHCIKSDEIELDVYNVRSRMQMGDWEKKACFHEVRADRLTDFGIGFGKD